MVVIMVIIMNVIMVIIMIVIMIIIIIYFFWSITESKSESQLCRAYFSLEVVPGL